MNRKEVVEWLHGLEARYPVEEWDVAGVSIWPVLKIQVMFWLFEIDNEKHTARAKKKKKVNRFGRIVQVVRSLYHYLYLRLRTFKRCDLLFVSSSIYRSDLKGISMNKYFDPMLDYLESELGQKSLLIEYEKEKPRVLHREDRIINVFGAFAFVNFLTKLLNNRLIHKRIVSLPGLSDCLSEIETQYTVLTKKYMLRRLINMSQTVKAWSCLFDIIFEKIRPKYVFGICYYTLPMYGMNLSAERNKIVSIDMQHGTQGPLHIGYSNFRQRRAGKYSVIPNYFWCWDNGSAEVLRRWISSEDQKAIVGGNPWINFIFSNDHFSLHRESSKKIILYTLQPIGNLLEDYIIEAIKESPDEYEWWLRLHPRQSKMKPHLIKLLEASHILAKVIINDPLEVPLPTVLKDTYVHISKFSGSVIEAALMDVPSIVIDEIGRESFQDAYLLQRICFLPVKSEINLLQAIKEVSSISKGLEKTESYKDKIKELVTAANDF
jgi:hypothetical protein